MPSWTFALVGLALLLAVPIVADRYVTILLTDIFCFALFAVSLHFIMGPAGMVSFGHAAYFGLGAYAAGLLLKRGGLPMEAALVLAPLVAGAFAVVYGWFCVRLSGVYLAMLTLAFAQISWSIVFQWDSFTGGSNGVFGVWPSAWLAGKTAYYYLALAFCGAGIALLWRVLFSPFGFALRAGRDSPLRAEAIGIDLRAYQWMAFVLVGALGGPGRRRLRLLQGQHLALDHLHRPVDRRADHGAAGRRRDPDRAARRCRHLHLAARRGRPPHRVLARRHGRGDPGDRAALPAGPGRRPQGADPALARGPSEKTA